MSQITLRDVAKQAGVSVGTASQALNNRPNVSPETRARVLEVAASMGYQMPMRVAISETESPPIEVMGILVKQDNSGPLALNPFYSYVLSGAERECQRRNISLMYANLPVDHLSRPISYPLMLTNNQVDGVLVLGTFLEDTIERIQETANLPIVLVDAYAPGQPFDSVVSDNINGAYQAVSYLIRQGHRHIGLVGSRSDAYPSIRERRKGYTRALKHHQLDQTRYIEDSEQTSEGVFAATLRLLDRAPEITAIFACNDNMAMGVMNAARELDLTIPDDLSLIGFDDIDLAQEVRPALTTVHVDKVMMGVVGVRKLIERAENPGGSAMTTTISTQLIVRESVAKIGDKPRR